MGQEPKHYPEPDYLYCNAGHRLVEVYDEKHNRFDWDCPICIKQMEEAERDFESEEASLEWETRQNRLLSLEREEDTL